MAQEAILTVSLKDYKKQIDDLRASLLNLDSADKEYIQTAEQIKSMQEKLNEVMGIGKKDADAVAGSYNALSQELSKLKKEWKTLEIGSERWVELGNQIDGINNKLKDADATVGVFGRNVGNYQQAFEGALNNFIGQLGKVSPELGSIGGTISKLIPIIKNVSKAATSSLKGIKAALATTGIGALIIALGILTEQIMKNSDKILDWIKGNTEARKSAEKTKKALDDLKTSHENYMAVLQASGANQYKILAANLQYIETRVLRLKNAYDEAVKDFGVKSKEAKEALKELKEAQDAYTRDSSVALATINKYLDDTANIDLKPLEREIKNINDEFEAQVELLQSIKMDYNVFNDLVKKLEEARNARIKHAQAEDAKKKWKEEENTISSLTKTIQDSFKTREQILTDQYNKEKRLLEKHHKDTKDLEKKYQNDMKRLMLETQDAILSSFNNLSSTNSAFTFDSLTQSLDHANARLKEFADIVGSKEFMPPGPPLEKTIEKVTSGMAQMAYEIGLIERADITEFAIAWQIAGTNVKAAENALSKYSYTYEQLATSIANHDEKMSAAHVANTIEGKLNFQIKDIETTLESIKDIYKRQEELPDLIEKASGEEKEALEKELKDIEKGIVRIGILKNDLNVQLQELKNQLSEFKISQVQIKYDNKAASANTNTDVSGFWNTTNFEEGFKARLEAEQFALASISQLQFESDAEREAAEIEHQQRLLEIQREYNEAKYQNYAALGDGIASIFDSIGNIYEQDIANQVKHGKLSEEQAENEYKKVQGIKIAVATIDTIQGALASFMGWQEVGQPWGAIIGAVQAAAVTAAGIAQIAQIKNTNPYSNSNPTNSFATATPTLREYSPEYFSNVTGANDTKELANAIAETPIKAYVVESDISSAQELAQQRDAETTF